MRLCSGLLCDNAADLWWHREAWCGACANQRFGASVGVIAALELRDPPATAGAGRPTRPHDREAGLKDIPSFGPAPGPSSLEDFEWIIENDGWPDDIETEMLAPLGMDRLDIEIRLLTGLQEGTW